MINNKWRLPIVFLFFLAISHPAPAATVDAQICVTLTVLEQSPYEIISGGSVCTGVNGSAVATVPGETVVFDDFNENFVILGGGVNNTGVTVNYTMQFDWTYYITTVAGTNETASALVRTDWDGLEFTSGSGSGSRIFTSSLENGIAEDYTASVYTEGHAASYAPVPLPAAGWLFGAGLIGFYGAAKKTKRQLTSTQARRLYHRLTGRNL